MKPHLETLTAVLVTATLVSAPAFAQQRDNKAREANRSAQESKGRTERQPSNERSVDRAQPRRDVAPAPTPAPRIEQRRDQPSPRLENRRDEIVGRAVPRAERPAVVAPRAYDRRYDGDRRYNYSRPYVYAPRSYVRPYVFRPRLSIGFGIFAGFPVPYSYSYGYPIEVYGYRAPRGPVVVGPGSSLYGGVALDIEPYDADVFVDGSYAGRVQDFDGTTQPLTLVAGTHRIEVQAAGLAPLVFDVTVQPGQVIPYRGELRP
jgi:hypothetical protein